LKSLGLFAFFMAICAVAFDDLKAGGLLLLIGAALLFASRFSPGEGFIARGQKFINWMEDHE